MNRKTESIRVKQLYGIFLAATLLLGACTQEEGYEQISPRKYPYQLFRKRSGNEIC